MSLILHPEPMRTVRPFLCCALAVAACSAPTAPSSLAGHYALRVLNGRQLPALFAPDAAGVDLVVSGGTLTVGTDDTLRVTLAMGPAGDAGAGVATYVLPYRVAGDSLVVPGFRNTGGFAAGGAARLHMHILAPVATRDGGVVRTEQDLTFHR